MDTFSKLLDDLKVNGVSYNFFQAVYWLEKFLADANIVRKIVFAPTAELSFPASDIRRFSFDQHRLIFQLNFMGFYGVDSPLPQYFFANLATDNEAKDKIKNFLNIFNQRIYQLFFAAWKKYRVHVQAENNQCDYVQQLIALSGNSLNHMDTVELAFAGLLGSRNHTTLNLKYLLREFLKISAIDIQEFIPTRVQLTQSWQLGDYNILGNNILIGNEITDLTHKIRIIIGPITSDNLDNFFPIRPLGYKLSMFIKRYLNPLTDFEIVIKYINNNCLTLGKNSFYLGWNSALGVKEKLIYSVIIKNQVDNYEYS